MRRDLYTTCAHNVYSRTLSSANDDDVIILVGSIYTLKENAEALVAATREIGLEVSADKTKYMVMSRDHPSREWKSLNIWEQL